MAKPTWWHRFMTGTPLTELVRMVPPASCSGMFGFGIDCIAAQAIVGESVGHRRPRADICSLAGRRLILIIVIDLPFVDLEIRRASSSPLERRHGWMAPVHLASSSRSVPADQTASLLRQSSPFASAHQFRTARRFDAPADRASCIPRMWLVLSSLCSPALGASLHLLQLRALPWTLTGHLGPSPSHPGNTRRPIGWGIKTPRRAELMG
jgi:hypothetical protein